MNSEAARDQRHEYQEIPERKAPAGFHRSQHSRPGLQVRGGAALGCEFFAPGTLFHAGQDAAVNERGHQRPRAQTGGGEPAAILGGAIGPAFGDREQGRRVQGDRQRAVERVVQKHVVNQQSPARGAARPRSGRPASGTRPRPSRAARSTAGSRRRPAATRIDEHVAGQQFQPIGDAILGRHLGGDLEHLGPVPHDGPQVADGAASRRCCRCPCRRRRRAALSRRRAARARPAPARRSWPGRPAPA